MQRGTSQHCHSLLHGSCHPSPHGPTLVTFSSNFSMDRRHDHFDARSGNTRRRVQPATNTQAYHEPMTIRRYRGVDVTSNTYAPAPTPSVQGPAYQHPNGPYQVSPCQSLSRHTEAGNEYLPHYQAEPRSSTGSERTSWCAYTQSSDAATSSISTPSEHQSLQHPRMTDPYRGQTHSLLPSTTSRLGPLQQRSNEADPRISPMPDGHSNSFWDPRNLYVDPARLQFSEGYQSQDEVAPWSSFNSRYQAPERGYTDQEQEETLWGSGNLGGVSTALLGCDNGISIQPEHQETSERAFNSDIENIIMEDLSNSQILESNAPHLQQASYGVNHPRNNVPLDRVAFRYRLDRAETPHNTETDVAYVQQNNLLVYLSPVPRSPDHDASSPSTVSSPMSITPSSEPAELQCSAPGCGETFHGKYRRGSLNRHMRLKHRGSPGNYPCAERSCIKTFKRSDARLKHYRRHHPWRANGPPVPRGPQGTQSTGSP